MTASLIDGKARADRLCRRLEEGVRGFEAASGRPPGLAAILAGDDPASAVYVRSKARRAEAIGIRARTIRLSREVSEDEVLKTVSALNADPEIDGILAQLPMPEQVEARRVIDAIRPDKDVDGFAPQNVGRLWSGLNGLIPCTPLGCSILIADALGDDLAGLEATVVGRSDIVGKPMAALLLARNASVTLCHSRTRDLAEACRRADVLVAAAGRARMIDAQHVKHGACVIDVGINRVDGKLVGDVDFDAAAQVARAITPVPGGVGPMTIACLMRNTLKAACQIHGIKFPEDIDDDESEAFRHIRGYLTNEMHMSQPYQPVVLACLLQGRDGTATLSEIAGFLASMGGGGSRRRVRLSAQRIRLALAGGD